MGKLLSGQVNVLPGGMIKLLWSHGTLNGNQTEIFETPPH